MYKMVAIDVSLKNSLKNYNIDTYLYLVMCCPVADIRRRGNPSLHSQKNML